MKTILVVLTVLSWVPASSASTIVFSDLQPGWLPCQCFPGAGDAMGATPNAFDPVTVGDPFTVPTSASFTLDAADMALGSLYGSPTVRVSLYDSVDDAPDTLLASTLTTGTLPAWSELSPLVTADFSQHPTLEAGQTYWLVATTVDPQTEVGWWMNNMSVLGNVYIHDSIYAGPLLACCTHYTMLNTFDILGTPLTVPTPEPESVLSVLIGVVMISLSRNRRRSSRP